MNKKIDKKDPKNQKCFLVTWFSDPSFKDWLASDEKSTRARCTICYKVIKLSSGRSALTVHESGKKHADIVAKVKIFLSQEQARLNT